MIQYHGVIPKIILLKVTSRQRPEQLVNCIKSYLTLADQPAYLKWLFTFDVDDNSCNSLGFCDSIRSIIQGDTTICFGHSNSKIHAINRDVESYTVQNEWHILLNVSDDQLAIQKSWDTIIRDSMPNDLDHSLWFHDGWQNRINTQEIIGHNYYKRFNYIYKHDYKSFFCDNESTEVAAILGKQIKDSRCIIKHLHPACDKNVQTDELYLVQNKNWGHDQDLYNNRKRLNFGI